MIPTEPIGSIPRPGYLIDALTKFSQGTITEDELKSLKKRAVEETVSSFEATGSPIITDGEQNKPSFVTYPLQGMSHLNPDGFTITFDGGHTRQLPKLTKGPFKYTTYASEYMQQAKKFAKRPLKQAVIAPSALSLLYPEEGISGYTKQEFLDDLVAEAAKDIRKCFESGAVKVQMDFTEGRLAAKLDPSKQLLKNFINLNNRVLDHFTQQERTNIGIHTCPGGDKHATHSGNTNYNELLPFLFELKTDNIYMQFSKESNKEAVLNTIKRYRKPNQTIYLGVIDVNTTSIEQPEQIRDLVVKAAHYIPADKLGTTDDCGFSPFCDDRTTARKTAFKKIEARLEGTSMAEETID